MVYQLTPEEKTKYFQYINKAFLLAIRTNMNGQKAEKWALKLTSGTLESPELHWAKSPEEAKNLYDSLLGNLKVRLLASLGASLGTGLGADLGNSFGDSLRTSLRTSLRDSLQNSIQIGTQSSFGAIPLGSFGDSFQASLRASILDSLWNSLRDSFWDTLREIGWIASYSFAEMIGVKFSREDSAKLKCYRKLSKHCFAVYALPGHIILVDKPSFILIKHGKLIDIEFG